MPACRPNSELKYSGTLIHRLARPYFCCAFERSEPPGPRVVCQALPRTGHIFFFLKKKKIFSILLLENTEYSLYQLKILLIIFQPRHPLKPREGLTRSLTQVFTLGKILQHIPIGYNHIIYYN